MVAAAAENRCRRSLSRGPSLRTKTNTWICRTES